MGLRETIFRCFAATASGGAPAEDDLAALNAALAAAPARQRVRHGGWDIGTPEPSAGTLLAPTLWSAADLLVGSQLARVRQCANPACGWLFLDNSKSGNRRWCSMSACGNRAKAHRHYLRQKREVGHPVNSEVLPRWCGRCLRERAIVPDRAPAAHREAVRCFASNSSSDGVGDEYG